MRLRDYALGDIVHEGTETHVYRAIHRSSGDRVMLKLPAADVPSPRVLGRLVHEHEVLTQLAAVPGVTRARELCQLGSSAALVLDDPGFRSLDRILAERGCLPVEAGLKLGSLLSGVLEGGACRRRDAQGHQAAEPLGRRDL